MDVLVTSGTGSIGTALTQELLSRDVGVSVLTRSTERASALPPGVRPVVGDLLDLDLLREEFTKTDAVFLNCPVGEAETFQGLLAIDVAKRVGLQHLVYLSGQEPERLFSPPHCGVKLLTEQVLKSSGVPWTILRPNTFMQNDLMLKDALLAGVYPLPLGGIGVARIDIRDIADTAAIVLTSPDHHGQTYTLAGPEALTGETTAAAWADALGRPVTYLGDDLQQFEDMLRTMMTSAQARDIWLMYEHFQQHGFPAPEGETERLTQLLGRPPRAFAEFTAQTAEQWRTKTE